VRFTKRFSLADYKTHSLWHENPRENVIRCCWLFIDDDISIIHQVLHMSNCRPIPLKKMYWEEQISGIALISIRILEFSCTLT